MRIQHNVTAMNSYRNFNTNNSSLSKNLEKLSSGYKINRAGDDAAGLAISEKMRAQISGLEGATKNAKDGISLVQTAEGALTEVHDMLNRMYTLAEQSANGTYEDGVDRAQLQKEVVQLRNEIDRIADSANFNGLKLLDGSLSEIKAPEDSISIGETSTIDFTDGVSVDSDGPEGATSQFELSIDKAFGAGDTLTLFFDIPQSDGSAAPKSLTLAYSGTAIDATDDALTFSGTTKEEQLASIMNRLKSGTSEVLDIKGNDENGVETNLTLADIFGAGTNADYNAGFTVTSSDGKLNFKAEAEAKLGTLHLSDVDVTNVDAGVSGITATEASANSNDNAVAANGVAGLVTGNKHYMVGDKLQFEFNLADEKTATATVEITEDMIRTDDTSIITNNIVEALKQTNFEDNKNTAGFDESQFKVSDFFDVKANVSLANTATPEAGSVSIRAIDKTSVNTDGKWFKLNDVKLAQNGSVAFSSINAASGTTVASGDNGTATGGSAGVKTVGINQNLAEGDTFTLEGKLADGRAFSVTLTAGKTENIAKNTFAVKETLYDATANNDDTLDSIAAVLNGNSKVTVTNSDGSTVEMKGSDIFGTNGTFSAVGSSATGLKITNRHTGAYDVKGLTGDITFAGINATEAAASGAQTQDGVDATPATMSLTFNKDEMEYGTAITISDPNGNNGKTFELVEKDTSAVTQDGNIRVVVGDLANASSEQIAEKFKDAINGELMTHYDAGTDSAGAAETYNEWAKQLGVSAGTGEVGTSPNYATIDGNKVTLTSAATGSTAKAATAKSTYGDKSTVTVGYETNADGSLKLKQGDTLVINGKTYQFDTTTRNLQDDNELIKVSDFTDKKVVAEAIKQAINEDFKGKYTAEVNDDNTVTISGLYDEEAKAFNSPSIEQSTIVTGGGLTLQIGDTSDGFNKLKLNIRDMHVASIGQFEEGDPEMALVEGKSINDINISTQDGAADALDVIKNAINMVSDVRGTLGASQNRLEHTINNLGVMRENIQNAESAIRDTDVAEEMMAYTKNNILVQSAQAMLAQANQLPQGVLQLLG